MGEKSKFPVLSNKIKAGILKIRKKSCQKPQFLTRICYCGQILFQKGENLSNNTLSINEAITFEQIAEIREDYYLAEKRNGFNLKVLLTGGYKDPSHFILELIQNAEDALATEVSIRLFDDRLVFSHNGSIEFDLDDIKGITGIGNTTKQQEDNTIGKFGIGFKSVFTICKTPRIYSPDFCFELRDICVPYKIKREPGFEKGTHFVLPFESDEENINEIYRMLNNFIENFSTDNLLFLTHINKVNLKTSSYENFYEKTKKERKCGDFIYYECDINFKSSFLGGHKHLLFERPLKNNDKLFISIAYELNHDRKISMLEKISKLFVFFPTKEETYLLFKIHGPYATTSTRENLSEKYTADNAEIMKQTVALYSYSLQCIKELGLVNVQFIEKLPITDNSSTIYKLFYEETKKILSTKPILPTNDGNNISAEKACIVGLSSLKELLKDEDIKAIFKDKEKWLDANITYDRTRYLRDYLIDIGSRELDFETFIRTVQDDFFLNKDDEWLLEFYKIAGDNIKTMKPYLSKKFIRTENNEMCSPFIGGIRNVFIPSPLSIGNTIKKVFNDSETALKFFRDIGLEPANTVDEIRQFLETLKNSKDEADYMVNLMLISEEYNSSELDKRAEIVEILNKEKCILSIDEESGKNVYVHPYNAFIENEGLRAIYKDIPKIFYLSKQISKEVKRNNLFKDFLLSIGVNNNIKLSLLKNILSVEEKKNLREERRFSSEKDYGYQIDKIELILNNINREKSTALWKSISKIDKKYFYGEYEFYYAWETVKKPIKSYFVNLLQSTKWLYTERNELVSPNEVYYDDICKLYPANQIIEEYFIFKPDVEKTLPLDIQLKLDLIRQIGIDDLRILIESYNESQENTKMFFAIDIDSCNVEVPITEIAFENPRRTINIEDLEKDENESKNEINLTNEVADFINTLYENEQTDTTNTSGYEKKVIARTVDNETELIGKWGEDWVFKQLKMNYIKNGYIIEKEFENSFQAEKKGEILTVTYHNANGEIQKGYDITIKKGEQILDYIEVKSRKDDKKEYFNVSGTQWEVAKKLEKQGEGNKYWIYLVTKAGTTEEPIRKLCNPYKNWIEGKLDADPICIKL